MTLDVYRGRKTTKQQQKTTKERTCPHWSKHSSSKADQGRTKGEGWWQTSWSPPSTSDFLSAVPRRLFCFGSLEILDVIMFCYSC